ncbi:proprotein convertase subtilisin/kexin type 5-like [Antedon mediterranea]|uniref:proprotein convertase subtilisin/kexin type 5-like n=1 Tax=Antedon mediterranea TaxID=105859 RepID=UPI003AF473F9
MNLTSLIPSIIGCLTLFLPFLSVVVGELYSNQFAVHVSGGEKVASSLALKYGFRYHGQIGELEDRYLFTHDKLSKRSAEISNGYHMQLAQESQVHFVEQQTLLHRSKRNMIFNDQDLSDEWYVGGKPMSHNVYKTWSNGFTGKGVVVSILDDGLEWTHPDLKDNYEPKASYDVNDHDHDPMPRYDFFNENKHGTRCAGVVAMYANNTICGVGIAYDAKIGGIRMLDGDVTDAVEAAALSYNPDVIDIYSSSWGPDDDGKTVDGPGYLATLALEASVTKGRKGQGSIQIWASGNGGRYHDDCNCDGYANSIYTLTVSGVTESGQEPWYAEECSSILATTFSSGNATQKQVVKTDLRGKCTEHHTGTSASAPMAAAMCALAFQANPNLSWRDMQYIVVETSNHEPLIDGNWKKNGAGFYVSNRYGFGLMDSFKMTQLAKTWKPLPTQNKCEMKGLYPNGKLSGGSKFKVLINTEWHCGNQVKYLEHVQVRISLSYSSRGNLNIWLTSPMGTRSRLLGTRSNDDNAGEFRDWPFMTTHNWGEEANGTWILEIEDSVEGSQHSGKEMWCLVCFLTTTQKVGFKSLQIASGCIHQSYLSEIFPLNIKIGFCIILSIFFLTGELHSVFLVLHGTETSHRVTKRTNKVDTTHRRKSRSIDGEPSSEDYSYTYSYDFDCHEQCSDAAGCSGPLPQECYKCKMYRDKQTDACVSTCPEGQFTPPEGHKRCRLCNPQCKTCFGHSNENCLTCYKDYFLREDSATCVESCGNGFFADDKGICRFCEASCYTCSNYKDFCTACPLGRYLNSQSRCVEECDNNEYISDDGMCRVCEDPCATCNGPHNKHCTTCNAGFTIKNGTCVQRTKCSNKLFINDNDECISCHPTCSECDGPEDHDCTMCSEPYILVDKHCLASCGDRQYVNEEGNCANCAYKCKTCVNSTACMECVDGWVLTENGCQEGCPHGMYEMDRACYSCHSTCKECTGGDPHDCIQCNQVAKRFLYKHKCILSCPSGYFEDTQYPLYPQCSKCDETCSSCDGPSVTDCTKCMDGLKYDSNSNRCTEDSFECPDNCICTDFQCDTCKAGFYYYNRKCVKECPEKFTKLDEIKICGACHPSCQTCSGISHHECTTCIPSYYLTPESTCSPDCIWYDRTYPNRENNQWECSPCYDRCAKCTGPQADDCLMCADGRFLFAEADGNGVLKHLCVEKNECGSESFADEQTNECVPCYPTCSGCNGPDATDCEKCKKNFSKDENGVCQSSCGAGQYFNTDSICKDCEPSCESCSGPTSADCLACSYSTFLMPNGKCVSHCNDTYYPDFQDNVCKPCFPTCLTCASYESSECLTCKEGFYLHMGRYCYSQCPVGYYEYDNSEELNCRQCSIECLDCMGEYLNCTRCDSGKFLHKGRCLGDCPIGYDGKSGHCVVSQAQQDKYICPPFCDECTGGYCTKCNEGYTIYFGGCMNFTVDCRENQFFDGVACQDCDASCRTCLGARDFDCLLCQNEFLLENGKCVSECSDGTYKDNDKCGECHSTCKTCKGPSQNSCDSCASGMYLGFYDSCENECPPGFYFNKDKDCVDCHENCKTCYGDGENNCLGCPRETYLLVDTCVTTCPVERGYFHYLATEDDSQYVSSTNECRTCSVSCLTCFGPENNDCTTCKNNLFLKGNKCVVNCGTYFYEDIQSKMCKPCNAGCESCNGPSADNCVTCKDNKYLVEGRCLEDKPEHHYCLRTPYGNECWHCHSSCLNCTEGGGVFDCDGCHPGHILDNGVCYPKCISMTYFNAINPTNSSCNDCKEPCAECYGSEPNQCITCAKGKNIHHIDQDHHYCVPCCEEGKPTEIGKCCECNKKDHCRPGPPSEDLSKNEPDNNNNNRKSTTSGHVTVIILSCLCVIVVFFAIFGVLQARSNRTLCFSTYDRIPTYYNGSNVHVVLSKEPGMPNRHEYMSPEEEDTDEYPSDDDENEEIY